MDGNRKRARSESELHPVSKKRRKFLHLAIAPPHDVSPSGSKQGLGASEDFPPGAARSDVPVATTKASISSLVDCKSKAQQTPYVPQLVDILNGSAKAAPLGEADIDQATRRPWETVLPSNAALREQEHLLSPLSSLPHQNTRQRASLSETDLHLATEHSSKPSHPDKQTSRRWLHSPWTLALADTRVFTERAASIEGYVYQRLRSLPRFSRIKHQPRPSSAKVTGHRNYFATSTSVSERGTAPSAGKSSQPPLTKANLREHRRLFSVKIAKIRDEFTGGALQEVRYYHS